MTLNRLSDKQATAAKRSGLIFFDRQLLCLLRGRQHVRARVCVFDRRRGGGYSIGATSGLISHSFAVAATWH